jgi:signal transduction histidine kinase
MGRLAAGIAHDFNNLLSVILSYAGELEEELEDSELAEPAKEIRAAAQRGAQLTRQLLTYGRRDSPERVPIDLNLAVLDAAALLGRTLGEHVRLTTRPAEGLPRVLLAPGQIERILVNLAANSRDAMPAGGEVEIRTELVAVPPGDALLGTGWFVRLVVRDDGTGMDGAVSSRAREPFFTTKDEGAGTGLGLATIHGIARGSNGDLRIDSAPGEGTTVALYLPAVRGNGDPLSMPGADPGEPTPDAA